MKKTKQQKNEKVDFGEVKMCQFCPRMIVKNHEVGQEYFLHNGKRMCMVCRAVKLSKFKKQIGSTAKKMRKDLKAQNLAFEEQERQRMFEVAAESQEAADKIINK